MPDLRSAVAQFGADAKAKLSNPAATGEPEDQLRAPLERLLVDIAELCGMERDAVVAVGETSLSDLKTRPDYAVSLSGALVGFIEVKAPGKGADPKRFRDAHDKLQWTKLQAIPNLIYTDGNAFALWRSGELVGEIVRLTGDIETAGAQLTAPDGLLALFEDFLRWQPIAPRTAKQLAQLTARLCRLMRDEVLEQLALGSPALTSLAADWRHLLFPDATDAEFADGYAQTVTFGLLVARARDIELGTNLQQAARTLGETDSLIGTALKLLTDDSTSENTLRTSLGTLTRVLDVVHWPSISRGDPDAWLYFYEDFLEVYDNRLRKLTGSYYTPPQVVAAMVRLVDDGLRTRYALPSGLASPNVTFADPAVGTGTFLLGALRQIAETVAADEGDGAVAGAVNAAVARMIAFELQLGPFAVAQLRILAELAEYLGAAPATPLRMFVTDTLANPYVEEEYLPHILRPIGESRRRANVIKRDERITVVIGNPPYKEKAKGRGGWVESGSPPSRKAPLLDWMPPAAWGVSAHAKHLRNLYVYFWRWATWKVFDQTPAASNGIVCFITVAGFVNGPGFEKMRDYLRRTADEIWLIDCSPEGHQPDVSTRVFEAVQQPICIMLVSRSPDTNADVPATVRYRALPAGHRRDKLAALTELTLDGEGWLDCPTDWRAPFLPQSGGAWSSYPALDDLFEYDGSGVMPGRTWVIAPDAESLQRRWQTLVNAPDEKKEALFHPHQARGGLGDRHVRKVLNAGLPGYAAPVATIAGDRSACLPPVRYGFRSFDRQWIIPDNRVMNRPNPTLWAMRSDQQVYLTAFSRTSPSGGPALTFSAAIPDHDHYKGSFNGRVFPLWRDAAANTPNVAASLLAFLSSRYGRAVGAEDVLAYIAAIAAHPAYVACFATDLVQPGLRIPLTADADDFFAAVDIGRRVIWLQTFGERFTDTAQGRPARPPRMTGNAPSIPAEGAIPQGAGEMPDEIEYEPATQRLLVGRGYVECVSPEMWDYEVSGKPVLKQWFSYRGANRERPIMGDRRPPSKLGEIQPDHWLAEYTSELLNVLHVLGLLIALEPEQATLLDRICSGATLSMSELRSVGALAETAVASRGTRAASDDTEQFSAALD